VDGSSGTVGANPTSPLGILFYGGHGMITRVEFKTVVEIEHKGKMSKTRAVDFAGDFFLACPMDLDGVYRRKRWMARVVSHNGKVLR
jgi:hypothetical protein